MPLSDCRRSRALSKPSVLSRWFFEVLAALLVLLMVVALSPAQADEAGPGPLDRAMGAVFSVHGTDPAGRFLGSAFLWGARGEVVVTNAHVVGDAAQVRLTDARGHQEVGQVIAVDAVRDVAVISVVPGRAGLQTAPRPALGQPVWALGVPLGLGFAVTAGVVSALETQVEAAVPLRMLQHDAAVNPGSSGGPLVDGTGRVVGMNSRIADGSRHFIGIAYAIAAPDLARIVDGLWAGTLQAHPQLGLRARAVEGRVALALGLAETGLLVDQVEPAGLAQASGVRPGDVILAVDGHVMTRAGDLPFAIEAALARRSADFAILRAGTAYLVSVDLAGQPRLPGEARPGSDRLLRSLADLGIGLGADQRIAAIAAHSTAERAGLVAGDRVLALNGATLDAAELRAVQISGPALVLVVGDAGVTRHVVLDPDAPPNGLRPVGGANVLDPAVVVF